ncbi:PDZ domain-containing protein [candidate division GN15 bacterium]|nr:PDZ domain-containing protein [candidate division GN15 bacterium]
MAVVCTIFGLILASQIDLTPSTVAEMPVNVGQTGAFPVVERDGEMESPFVAVVESVQDAVVNISARTKEEDVPWYFQGRGFGTSSGSGFFFREDGYILTNNHVIEDAVEVVVRTSTGYEYEARVVGRDKETDLAVVKVEPEEPITVIPFGDSEALKVGDWAIAIGNPFPQQGLERTVTVGVISAKGRTNLRFGADTPRYQNYIQTDASINPGNSGGPLLNLRGECIGVNAAISSPTGSSVGIGFAIPINLARAIVPDLIQSGKAARGWLGVWLSPLTEREAKRQGLSAVRGVRIDSVFENSPAEQAGVRQGDIVIGFNEKEVLNSNQFSVLVSTVRAGQSVPIDVVRDGEEKRLRTTVVDREQFLASMDEPPTETGRTPTREWLGMELVSFTPQMARDIGIQHVDGLYVIRVYPGTPADRASITEGTIVLQVNNEPVASLTDIREQVGTLERSRTHIPFIVQEPDGSIARKVIRP